MNPARSSDMIRCLWSPRVMGQPEDSTVVSGGGGYDEGGTATLLPHYHHHCAETTKGALRYDR